MMEPCQRADAWVSGALSPEEAAVFARHLETCDDCRRYVERVTAVQSAYARWVRAGECEVPPNAAQARQFARAVLSRNGTQRPLVQRLSAHWRAAAAAALVLLSIAAILFVRYRPPSETAFHAEKTVAQPAQTGPMPVGSQLFETAVDEERVVSLGPHQLTLGKGTRLTVSRNGDAADTEIKLAHGTVFCDVAPLSPGGSFRILAGDTVVSVLGTSFLVSFDGDARLQVAVMKGRVRVQHGSETRLLEAGDTLSLPADEPAVVPENVPVASGSVRETDTGRDRIRPSADFDSWRAMISAGRHEEAAAGIRTYLTAEPSDDRARMLLAGVERRQGRHVDALASYDQVIANRSSHLVHQARYLCAEISRTGLGDHERAIGYYDAYLNHAPADAVNRPEAELHLSESLLATGRTAQARAHLENISRQYGRTPVADRARALLEKIATPRP